MNKLREQVKYDYIPVCNPSGHHISEKDRNAMADELITLIRTATLDEVEFVIDSLRTYSPAGDSMGLDKYIDKKQLKPAIDSLRGDNNG